jgi:hypothetical protein
MTDFEDALNKSKTEAWNRHLSSQLEAMRSWLNSPQWEKGFRAYLSSLLALQLTQLVAGTGNRDNDQFLRGQIANLREIMDFKETIEKQALSIERQQASNAGRGDAGY